MFGVNEISRISAVAAGLDGKMEIVRRGRDLFALRQCPLGV